MKGKTEIEMSNPKNKFTKQLIGIIICVVLIVGVCLFTYISNIEKNRTIAVCMMAQDLEAGKVIREEYIQRYDMNYLEYEKCGIKVLSDGSKVSNIVTWDNKNALIGKYYSASYLYKGNFLMPTMVTTEVKKQHSYLYSMDGELLNIKMNTADFGEMVVPGDRLNIYASYIETVYDLPTEEEYLLSGGNNTTGVQKYVTRPLFNECTVLDMLNGDGKSIYDIYYDFMEKTKAEQTSLLESPDFRESVTCSSILLQVTPEEALDFADIERNSPSYLMTLLPRTESNAIIDSLSNINNLIGRN